MKKWKVALLLGWLVLLVVMFAGCDKPYLPGDFAAELDNRIIELQRAKELYPSTECAKVIGAELTFLEELQEASK